MSVKIPPIHPFPARMAPDLALRALEDVPSDGRVLDPMAGSGTVLRAAAELGIRGVGLDIDPLAVMIANAWTTPIRPDLFLRASRNLLERAASVRPADVKLPWMDDDPATKDFVDYWFEAKQRDSLRRVVASLPPKGDAYSRILGVIISRLIITKDRGASIARDTSHSRPHRIYFGNDYDVFDGFWQAARKIGRILEEHPVNTASHVRLGDARCMPYRSKSIDAIITSPPYINALDYMRGHRLALVWLGWSLKELTEVRNVSVGAERSLRDWSATHLDDMRELDPDNWISNTSDLSLRWRGVIRRYAFDLVLVLRECHRVLRKVGSLTVVVGNSKIRGTDVETAELVKLIGHKIGFVLEDCHQRALPDRHRYLPPPAEAVSQLDRRMKTEVVMRFGVR